ncbi:hypothetical protein TNCV_1316601 [Trichonephila clavipes]|nr:hypothetical protein TNCV_1316601 [Trichonephila clavipes]
MAGKDILEFVQSSENIIDGHSDDEINNEALVSTTSEMKDIMKRAQKGPDKLDLTRLSVYQFRSSSSNGACRSSVPRARNELKSALSTRLGLLTHQLRVRYLDY